MSSLSPPPCVSVFTSQENEWFTHITIHSIRTKPKRQRLRKDKTHKKQTSAIQCSALVFQSCVSAPGQITPASLSESLRAKVELSSQRATQPVKVINEISLVFPYLH